MNRIAFTIFNIPIYWYSICILLGIVVSYFIIIKESKKQDINENFILNLFFYGIIIGVIGARIYYVIFNFSYYSKNVLEIFAFRNGGLAIHGGIISSLIFVYYYSKKNSINFVKILDILVPGVIIAQAIGRWGNFFNMEAHGGITTYSNLKKLLIPQFIIDGMKIDGSYYYPTFYFESIWCLIGFIILILLRRNKNIKLGVLSSFYFIYYSIGRFFIESLRTDSLMILNLKMAQVVSIFGIIIGIIMFIISYKKNIKYNKKEV